MAGNSYFDGTFAGMTLLASPTQLSVVYSPMSIIQSEWGIWSGQLYGTYSASIPPSNSWSLELVDANVDAMHMGMYIQGGAWSANRFTGNAVGYWAATDTGQTGILAGSLLGTYDSSASTFNSVAMGMYLETNQFLTMAGKIGSSPNLAALQALNIPAVEVGRTTLVGSNGFSSVTIADAIFFASSTGQKPQLWASGNVSGTYITNYGSIPMTSTSGLLNLQATFNMQNWNTTAGSWWASIDNGSGSGLVFKGFAAGPITGDSAFSGTAAGAVDPASPFSYAEYLGGSTSITAASVNATVTVAQTNSSSIQMTFGNGGSWSYDASGNYSGSQPLSTSTAGASGGYVYSDSQRLNQTGYWISTLSGTVNGSGNISGTSNFAAITQTTLGMGTGVLTVASTRVPAGPSTNMVRITLSHHLHLYGLLVGRKMD